MADKHDREATQAAEAAGVDAMSIVQRGNLKTLEKTLRKQWRLGQNIVLCWSADERGLLVIMVPHYYLGNYCAADDQSSGDEPDNETFVRELISGNRRKTREELFAVSNRLDVPPTFIKLNTALAEEPGVLAAVEQLIKRYGLSYVQSRGVLLFDIVEFSLFTPFEQASQLNSLSYSMNSAYNKLLAQGIKINFARTTTGDELPTLEPLMHADEILAFQHLVRRVPVPDHIYQTAVKLVRKTRPQEDSAPDWLKPLVSWGAGPRAVQFLILGGKTRAALQGQYMVRLEDIQAVAEPVLTHRLITTFAAQSEGVDARQIVKRLVEETVQGGLTESGTMRG